MNYKAENVDTDKVLKHIALKHIEWDRRCQDEAERLEIAKMKKFYEGIREGLDIAEGIFECSNFEKQETEATYCDGVLDAIYEISKGIDVVSQDLKYSFKNGDMSLDDVCSKLVERIRDRTKE